MAKNKLFSRYSKPSFLIWLGSTIVFIIVILSLKNTLLASMSKSQKNAMPQSSTNSYAPIPSIGQKQQDISAPSPQLISPTTQAPKAQKYIIITGLTYEDTNQDYQYNNGEPYLGYMHLRYFDTQNPSTIYDMYSNSDGTFTIKFSVWGDLAIIPSTNLNYLPMNSQQSFGDSANNVKFGFRTSGAVNIPNAGSIQGDIFQDSNHNSTRDPGENGVYFYKIYLKDSQGNIYNTSANAQATDQGGYFSYTHLPLGDYTLLLSNPSGAYTLEQSSISISLTSGTPNVSNVEVPVIKN